VLPERQRLWRLRLEINWRLMNDIFRSFIMVHVSVGDRVLYGTLAEANIILNANFTAKTLTSVLFV
jgi:hypothetical protein